MLRYKLACVGLSVCVGISLTACDKREPIEITATTAATTQAAVTMAARETTPAATTEAGKKIEINSETSGARAESSTDIPEETSPAIKTSILTEMCSVVAVDSRTYSLRKESGELITLKTTGETTVSNGIVVGSNVVASYEATENGNIIGVYALILVDTPADEGTGESLGSGAEGNGTDGTKPAETTTAALAETTEFVDRELEEAIQEELAKLETPAAQSITGVITQFTPSGIELIVDFDDRTRRIVANVDSNTQVEEGLSVKDSVTVYYTGTMSYEAISGVVSIKSNY